MARRTYLSASNRSSVRETCRKPVLRIEPWSLKSDALEGTHLAIMLKQQRRKLGLCQILWTIRHAWDIFPITSVRCCQYTAKFRGAPRDNPDMPGLLGGKSRSKMLGNTRKLKNTQR